MKQRNMFWDNYKGILIFLVVFGHCIYSYSSKIPDSFVQNLYLFIYSFHMPAFIFCSGYFSKSERSRNKESLTNLLLYYIVFNTLMMLFAYFYMGTDFKFLKPYYSYWYILALVVWRILMSILGNSKIFFIISLIVSLTIGYTSEFSNVLATRRILTFFVFFIAGYLLDREKIENFISRRKPYIMFLSSLAVIVGSVICFLAVKKFEITSGMTLMNTYKNPSDIIQRILIFLISFAAIIGMFFTVPNRKIPFLTNFGKNSLLIYLAHRFITIIYYKDIFSYRTYTSIYILYALIASFIICVVFGNNKLNELIRIAFTKLTTAILEPDNKTKRIFVTIMTLIFAAALCFNSTPLFDYISELIK